MADVACVPAPQPWNVATAPPEARFLAKRFHRRQNTRAASGVCHPMPAPVEPESLDLSCDPKTRTAMSACEGGTVSFPGRSPASTDSCSRGVLSSITGFACVAGGRPGRAPSTRLRQGRGRLGPISRSIVAAALWHALQIRFGDGCRPCRTNPAPLRLRKAVGSFEYCQLAACQGVPACGADLTRPRRVAAARIRRRRRPVRAVTFKGAGGNEVVGIEERPDPVPEGEEGEIVGTSFHVMATPFIRYRTMDIAVKGPPCCQDCGRRGHHCPHTAGAQCCSALDGPGIHADRPASQLKRGAAAALARPGCSRWFGIGGASCLRE
jgi:hypothetical protein